MTQDCIDSIFTYTKGVDFEIILVDNASTDGSREHFAKDSRIKYIYSNENLGFGRGNNLGLKVAQGDYLFLLNSDTLLLNNAILEFCNWMDNQPNKVGCAGCVLVDANDQPVNSFQDMQSIWYFFKSILGWYHIRIKPKYHKDKLLQLSYPRKVGFVVGADMFIRKECIETCGAFDADFFMYYEETEMQYRFHKAGYESWCISTPQIKHLVGRSGGTKRNDSLRKLIGQLRSRYLYIEKTHGLIEKFIIYIMHLLYLPLLPLKRALPGERKDIIKILLTPFIQV